MKKLITTIVLIGITFTTVHSQISRPNNRLKIKKINTTSQTQSMRIANLDKKSMKDLSKLNIPITNITSDKLNAKPIKTWRIRPTKLYDGQLRLKYFNGHWSEEDKWIVGQRHSASFTFRAQGGVEYRMKLKVIKRRDIYYRESDYIYVTKNNDRISKVPINEHNEFNYLFKQTDSGIIEFFFTAIPVVINGKNTFRRIRFSEIRIDRIN